MRILIVALLILPSCVDGFPSKQLRSWNKIRPQVMKKDVDPHEEATTIVVDDFIGNVLATQLILIGPLALTIEKSDFNTLKENIVDLKMDLKADMMDLKMDMTDLKADLKADMMDMKGSMTDLKVDFHDFMHRSEMFFLAIILLFVVSIAVQARPPPPPPPPPLPPWWQLGQRNK